jgi:hypothetical protein
MRVAEMVASGLVATLLMDVWQRVLSATAGVPPSDWSLVGRWFGHVPRGRLFHAPIGQAAPVANERAIGWIGHYATGIVYGFVYVPLIRALGLEPSILNGLVFGAASVVVPWFFFMPAMGAGVLARNTPNPPRACLLSFLNHVVFGLGLAIGAIMMR